MTLPYDLKIIKKNHKAAFLDLDQLRILDIHDFISDMVLLHAKNKAVFLKVANSVVHVYKDEECPQLSCKRKCNPIMQLPAPNLRRRVDRSPMNTLMSIPKNVNF